MLSIHDLDSDVVLCLIGSFAGISNSASLSLGECLLQGHGKKSKGHEKTEKGKEEGRWTLSLGVCLACPPILFLCFLFTDKAIRINLFTGAFSIRTPVLECSATK